MNTTKTLTRRPQSKPARSRVLGAAPPSKPTEGTSAYVQQNGKAKMTEPVKAMLLEDGPDIPNKNGVEHITRSSSRVADDINNVSPIFYDDVLPVPSARKLSFRTKVNKTETEYRTNEGTPLNRLEDLEESNEENNSLACPICNETMVTLLQLNRHLDDVHQTVDKVENEDLKSWFQGKVRQAKQLQKVTDILNQKRFGRIDFFDSTADNDESSDIPNLQPQSQRKPGPTITRAHWQKLKTSGFDYCSDPTCSKILGTNNGLVNCRKCGRLFCNDHTRYRMRLSVKARHDPDNGIWSRVCETCYKSRKGYNDNGYIVDLTSSFKALRQRRVDNEDINRNKLEKRLTKLINLINDIDEKTDDDGSASTLFSLASVLKRRNFEHQVVPWIPNDEVKDCPICLQHFSLSLRKHHCRLCGCIICADHSKGCSREVPMFILKEQLGDIFLPEIPSGNNGIRICRNCKDTLFSKRNFMKDLQSEQPILLQHYEHLANCRRVIEILMPKFQNALAVLDDSSIIPSKQITTGANKLRTRLLESFTQYDKISRQIVKTNVEIETEKRLKKTIYSMAVLFLQENMLPLKSLPNILKHSNSNRGSPISSSQASPSPSPSPTPTPTPTPVQVIEPSSQFTRVPTPPEEKPNLSQNEIEEYRNQLIVMEEQKYLVGNMIKEATARRKFDEVAPLQQSLDDLEIFIEDLRKKLGSEGF